MAKYVITGGNKLRGTHFISGNKNSTFPCIAAALLTREQVVIHNVPKIVDVDVLIEILNELGVSVVFNDHTLTINAEKIITTDLPENLTTRLRGSVVLAGALLSREGKVSFSHPGGDIIGKRDIDIHLAGFESMGYKVSRGDREYRVSRGFSMPAEASIFFRLATVTGTENVILAAILRKGTTTIRYAAQEPHVVDLCNLLVKMGAKIHGIGTSTIKIEGVESLSGTDFTIGADYIEFGTYAVAAALTGGEIELTNCQNLDLEPVAWALTKMGVNLVQKGGSIVASARRLTAIPDLRTNFWPGFPTDLMSAMIVLATQANGVSLMHDWIYESRMFFVDKLIAMGANITIADPHRVLVYGPSKLVGRNLETPDIRAGMAILLAALIAKGESVINRAELIERGYENVVENLSALGAQIQRVEE